MSRLNRTEKGRFGTMYGKIVGLDVTLFFLVSHVDSAVNITEQFVLLSMIKIMLSKVRLQLYLEIKVGIYRKKLISYKEQIDDT